MEKQEVTAVTILKLSAAFDTVDHELLFRSHQQKIWNIRQST